MKLQNIIFLVKMMLVLYIIKQEVIVNDNLQEDALIGEDIGIDFVAELILSSCFPNHNS